MSGWEIRSPPPLEDRRFGFDVRYLRGTIAVLLLVVFWSVIVPLIDRSLDSITIPPGTVVEIGHTGVTFTPALGWVTAGVFLPADQTIKLFKEGVTFEVHVGIFHGTSLQLLHQIRDVHREFSVEGNVQALTVPQGIEGVTMQILGANFGGALFAFVSGGKGIEVIARGPDELLPRQTQDVGRMIASLRVTHTEGQE